MKNLDVLAAGLVIVGALNWGLAGLFHLDLVATLFGMRFGEIAAQLRCIWTGRSRGTVPGSHLEIIQRRWHTNAAVRHSRGRDPAAKR